MRIKNSIFVLPVLACCLLLVGANKNLENQTITDQQTHKASGEIQAGNNFTIETTGDVKLKAGRKIVIKPGFTAKAGSKLVGNISYIEWNGQGSDNNWSNPANWRGGVVPTTTDDVLFDDDSAKQCIINQNVDVASLTIAADYTGLVDGGNFSITINEGNLEIVDASTHFDLDQNTVVFSAAADQQILYPANTVIGTVENAKSGGTLEFLSDNITLTTLKVNAGTTTLLPATTMVVTDLDLQGTAGNLAVIRSRIDSDATDLQISGTQTITYVDFKDIDTSNGLAIAADATCVDSGGNTGVVFPDVAPPTAVQNLIVTGVTDTTVSLSWSASTDNVGVTGYKVLRNDVEVDDIVATTFTDTSLAPGTTYTYKVKAHDAAGNVSPDTSVQATTTQGTPDDTDADGLPDAWENLYFGNLDQGPAGDFDSDGADNLTEFKQGRDPTKGVIADPGDAVALKVYQELE